MLLLTFTVAGEPYALNVAAVVELVPRVPLRAVPHAPDYLAGLLEYRGEVVPVVDLGVLLGSNRSGDKLSTRIILVAAARGRADRDDARNPGSAPAPAPAARTRRAGLIAEQVIDLVEVAPEQVTPAPVRLDRAPYLNAIARTDRGFMPLVGVEALLFETLSAMPALATTQDDPATRGADDA